MNRSRTTTCNRSSIPQKAFLSMSKFWLSLTERKRDLVFLAIILGVIVSVFAKTVFQGQPISRVGMVASRDVLLRAFCNGVPPGYDESVYLLVSPYYFLVSSYWHLGQLPLWNPYSGWGAPLIGDIQSAAFSPLRILFGLMPTMYALNLLLVVQVALAATGMFLLARSLKLSRYAALFAGLTYTLCPYTLHYLELLSGTSSAFMPLLLFIFVELGKRTTALRIVVAAVATSLFIFMGHPESSFVGISFASLLMLLLYVSNPADASSLIRKSGRSLCVLTATGAITFCLCAPVLFTFLELFLNSDCYKFSSAKTPIPPWQGIVLNLLQPLYGGASPYLGSFMLPLLLLSLRSEKEERRRLSHCLTAIAAVCFLFITRPGVLGEWVLRTPLSFVPGIYAEPVLLIVLILLSGYGLEECAIKLSSGLNKGCALFVSGVLIVLLVPFVAQLLSFDIGSLSYDDSLPPMSFSIKYWVTNAVVLGVGTLAIFLSGQRPVIRSLAVAAIIALNFVSEALPARYSMPVQSKFQYQRVDPIPFLAKQGERVLTLGFDVLSPNNNFVFRIPSISVHNVMFPDRYLPFMRAAGAKITTFNIVVDKIPLSRLIDFAGIRYVVSLGPVTGESDSVVEASAVKFGQPVGFKETKNLKLSAAAVSYDTGKSELWGKLGWIGAPGSNGRYVYSVVVTDIEGKPRWYGGLNSIRVANGKDDSRDCLTGLVPLSLKPGDVFKVGIQVFDSKLSSFLSPVTTELKTEGPIITLGTYSVPKLNSSSKAAKEAHFSLVSESMPQFVRVYENRKALPQAYVVHSAEIVSTGEQALRRIQERSFNPKRSIVIEGDAAIDQGQTHAEAGTAGDTVTISRPSPQEVVTDVTSALPGYLVLSDLFYPGWEARIDGKHTAVLRANYLFRAVRLPAGKHQVRFMYTPVSFWGGMALALLALLACIAVIVSGPSRRFGQKKAPRLESHEKFLSISRGGSS